MKVYYDKDADLSLVKGKNVTIIETVRTGTSGIGRGNRVLRV